MDPSRQPLGRSRGRGRALYQHPEGYLPPGVAPAPIQRWSLAEGGPRPPAPPSRGIPVGVQSSSSSGAAVGRSTPSGTISTSRDEVVMVRLGRSSVLVPTSIGSDPTKHIVYPPSRQVQEELQNKRLKALVTRPDHAINKCGSVGQKITLRTNYFRLNKKPEWNIFQYRVDFEPNVELKRTRYSLVRELKEMFQGAYLFDGSTLFLTIKLPEDPAVRTVKGENDEAVNVTIKFTTVVSMLEEQAMQILNIIMRKSMDGLKLQTVGRNKFDADEKKRIPSLKVEIWPGYITSIRQHEQDILLCAEITHKIMRVETVYDVLNRIRKEERDYKNAAEKALLGSTVLTDFNNKTYRIDDIRWDESPKNTFPHSTMGDVSFADYFKNRYQQNVRDLNQPLLVSNPKARDVRGGNREPVKLIPELCRATGLTEDMRSNFKTMRELSEVTRVGPADRMKRLVKFNKRLADTDDSIKVLKNWNLELDPQLITIPGRILPSPKLLFGNRDVELRNRTDWTSEFRNCQMFKSIECKKWVLMASNRNKADADTFVQALKKAAEGMGFLLADPKFVDTEDDRAQTYSAKITEWANKNPALIMCVVPNDQADRYSVIKKKCYGDFGVASQVIKLKTIIPKDKSRAISGLLSVATKVAIQMNCKLGGVPWMMQMPVNGLMTVGYDVCHDPKDKKISWGALVATMDLKKKNNEFFSAVNRHSSQEEMSNHLASNMAKAMNQFYEINGTLPEKILFFRDGVGEGQIQYVAQQELEVIRNKLKETYYHQGIVDDPKFTFMIVTKRVNTRLFFGENNPEPGTVVDDIITLPEAYDFYLIPQSVRQGTVSPTGFNIIYDTSGLTTDNLQQLAFRFTFLYFNWSGTVRVPAPCQFAHKLAFITSQSMQGNPHNSLCNKLYFL